MKRKGRKMLSVCGTLFVLAVVSSQIDIKACLIFTAVFWVVAVFLLRGKMPKRMPLTRDLTSAGLIILAYPAALYMAMGLGDDIAGLIRAVADDIAGLMAFPLREKAVYTLWSALQEVSKAKDCVVSVVRTGRFSQIKSFDWRYNYLILGIIAGCLLLITACRCIPPVLGALFEGLSGWLRSRKAKEAGAAA